MTIFIILGNDGKNPSFDMTEMESYDPSFRIDSSLWDQPLISLSEASQAAYTFLSFNFDEAVLESLSVMERVTLRIQNLHGYFKSKESILLHRSMLMLSQVK